MIFLSGCVALETDENQTSENETGLQGNETDKQTPEQFVEEHEETPKSLKTFRDSPETPSEYERVQLPECGNVLYSTVPVDLSKVIEITPLGNLGPPGHTFPTEHTFIHFSAGGTTTETHPLYMPADVRILLISLSYGATQDPVDYTIYFASCKDVIGYYNHVKEIFPELQKMVDNGRCEFTGETKTTRCNVQIFESIKAGTLVGRVGRLQGNFDFGTFDLSKNLTFANPSRYGIRSLHIQCPFGYYDSNNREKFFNLITRNDAEQCGSVAQDVAGTLKGNWFFGNSRADMGTDWNKYLAFVNDNKDPSTQVVSIGGTFTDAGKLEFKPQSSGMVNREFSQVKPDDNIYCYEGSISGRIVVQMTSDTQLKIEKQNGSCAGSFAFSNPTIYER